MNRNRRSVATIDSPEFINITGISPLISKCEIKVFYLGENRNRTKIEKDVAIKMAQTLPGCPIVGYYVESKEDFGDHGDQIIIDAEGVKFKNLTRPYGFVAPDTKVWFQKFDDTDEFGNITRREYLMTEGYLWTGQYEEAKAALNKGQSMELDEDSLKGYWATDDNRGLEFFIINDAVFSNLCILGDDVEPCFEGSDLTPAAEYSADNNFARSLTQMMKELKYALSQSTEEGGYSMGNDTNVSEPKVDNENVDTKNVNENYTEEQGKNEKVEGSEIDNTIEDYSKASEEDDRNGSEEENNSEEEENNSSEEKDEENKSEEGKKGNTSKHSCKDDEDKKGKSSKTYTQEEYDALNTAYQNAKVELETLMNEAEALRDYKKEVEEKEKDELIKSFYMLSEEDKKDVIENKAKYSLEDIKAKLCIICVDKRVNFSLDGNNREEDKASEPAMTYNLDSDDSNSDSLPAWLKAVENVKKANK